MTRASDRDSEAGFTLIEALVGLTLAALISALSVLGVRGLSSNTHRLQAEIERADQLESLGRVAGAAISQAEPPAGPYREPGRRFSGAAKDLVFSAPLPIGVAAGAIGAYRLSWSRDGFLKMAWTLDRDASDSGELPSYGGEEALAVGVKEGTFAYFGQRTGEAEAEWGASWADEPRLPELIRLRWIWRGKVETLDFHPLLTRQPCADAPDQSPDPSLCAK